MAMRPSSAASRSRCLGHDTFVSIKQIRFHRSLPRKFESTRMGALTWALNPFELLAWMLNPYEVRSCFLGALCLAHAGGSACCKAQMVPSALLASVGRRGLKTPHIPPPLRLLAPNLAACRHGTSPLLSCCINLYAHTTPLPCIEIDLPTCCLSLQKILGPKD